MVLPTLQCAFPARYVTSPSAGKIVHFNAKVTCLPPMLEVLSSAANNVDYIHPKYCRVHRHWSFDSADRLHVLARAAQSISLFLPLSLRSSLQLGSIAAHQVFLAGCSFLRLLGSRIGDHRAEFQRYF